MVPVELVAALKGLYCDGHFLPPCRPWFVTHDYSESASALSERDLSVRLDGRGSRCSGGELDHNRLQSFDDLRADDFAGLVAVFGADGNRAEDSVGVERLQHEAERFTGAL